LCQNRILLRHKIQDAFNASSRLYWNDLPEFDSKSNKILIKSGMQLLQFSAISSALFVNYGVFYNFVT